MKKSIIIAFAIGALFTAHAAVEMPAPMTGKHETAAPEYVHTLIGTVTDVSVYDRPGTGKLVQCKITIDHAASSNIKENTANWFYADCTENRLQLGDRVAYRADKTGRHTKLERIEK